MKALCIVFVIGVTNVAFLASAKDFSEAAAEGERNAKSPEGHEYNPKFIQSVRKAFSDAMESCFDGPIEPDSRYDAVFIISKSGRVEHTLTNASNPFADCIASNLRLPASVAKPPKANWAEHVQVVHGQVKEGEADPLITTFIDYAGPPRQEGRGAVAAYASEAIAIEEKAVGDAVKEHSERLGKNRVKTMYEIEESGQIRDLKIVAEKPNQWLEEAIRRAVSTIKFPPVPKEVSRETGIVKIENDFLFA